MRQEIRPEKDGIYIIEVEDRSYDLHISIGSRITYDYYADGKWLFFDNYTNTKIIKIIKRVDDGMSQDDIEKEIVELNRKITTKKQ